MIITLINCKININENEIYCKLDDAVLDKLKFGKCIRRKLVFYKFFLGKELVLNCPMLKIEGGKNAALWPSDKLPGRPYPVYVYLYAVAIYLTEKISMRKAAEKTCEKFNLATFSHSTLSRVLKRLRPNIRQSFTLIQFLLGGSLCCHSLIKRKHWSEDQTEEYKNLLEVTGPVLVEGRELPFGANLNYTFYNVTQKFII